MLKSDQLIGLSLLFLFFLSLKCIKGKASRTLLIILLWGGIYLISCARNPYASTNRLYNKKVKAYARSLREIPLLSAAEDSLLMGDYWVGTTNFNLRKPNYVVIHHTAQHSTEQTLNTFTLARTKVSAHFVIGRDGKVYQMLNNYLRAWHGGIGKWGNTTDLNSASIGIELDNNGSEPFAEAQINSLLKVLIRLKRSYDIPTANFIGHSDIAPSRKVDPNPTFPWEQLAENGFGLWHGKDFLESEICAHKAAMLQGLAILQHMTLPDSAAIQNSFAMLDSTFVLDTDVLREKILDRLEPRVALRIIGYDTQDLPAAIKAFKLHFIQKDINARLSREDKIALYNLYRQCL